MDIVPQILRVMTFVVLVPEDSPIETKAPSLAHSGLNVGMQSPPAGRDARRVEGSVDVWNNSQFPQLYSGEKTRTKVTYPPQHKYLFLYLSFSSVFYQLIITI